MGGRLPLHSISAFSLQERIGVRGSSVSLKPLTCTISQREEGKQLLVHINLPMD